MVRQSIYFSSHFTDETVQCLRCQKHPGLSVVLTVARPPLSEPTRGVKASGLMAAKHGRATEGVYLPQEEHERP